MKNESTQPKKAILANLAMFMCFFSFYYLFVFHTLPEAGVNDILPIVQATFSFTVALTVLAVSILKPNLGKKHFTIFSVAIIVLLPLLLILSGSTYVLPPIFLISIFFGISQLAYYKVFWTITNSAKRSKIAGFIGLGAVILYTATLIFSSVLDLSGNIALCLALIGGGTIGSLLIRNVKDYYGPTRKMVYYPERRTIILYAVPWVLFSFLNVTLTKNITVVTSTLSSSSLYLLLYGSQVIGGIFGALLGGYFADKVGRRLTLVFSVALYGVSMAFRGFSDNGVALLFSFIGEGLTWGIFLTVYSFVIWGDLSNTKNVAKTYAIGLIPFYVTAGIGSLNLFAGISVVNSTLISCILIFLAIIPIALAPELLPSETQENSNLKKYISTVRKMADDDYSE
jgi:hypothetical protein